MAGEHDARVQAQFTHQVDSFVVSPHVNDPGPLGRFLALVAPQTTERAIDVACGPGLLARDVGPRVARFTGIDLTAAMIARAQKLAREAGLAHADFTVGHASALPVRSASADLALTRLALHHLLDPAAALMEIARVLRSGGRAGIFDMTTSEDPEEAAYHHRVEVLRDPSHARALPLSGLLALAGRAGLDAERLEVVEYEIDVEEWLARAAQSAEARTEARALLAAAVGTRRLGGRRVWRDTAGRLFFGVRAAMLLARKP